MNPGVRIPSSGFQQDNLVFGIAGQSVGENASGGSCTNDNEIRFDPRHF